MIKMRLIILILLFCSTATVQAATTIVPYNGEIRYTGRWDHSAPLQPWAYWIGSSITAKFTGTSISATLSSGNTDYLRIIIDGNADDSVKISISSGEQTYLLADGLTGPEHTVEMVKETDAGRLTFHQFLLDDGAEMRSLPAPPLYKISFYGDSNLAGYSLESEQNESDRSLRGSYYGYAGITARMFDAEYENISRSGATLRSMNNAFDRVDYWSRTPAWDFSKFQPYVVVVNLGANDVGRPKNRIKSYYHAFLDDLRAVYPSSHIMLFNSWGWDYNEPANYIHEVIEERSDPDMSWAVFPWIFEQWHGCEYDHAGMAQVLAEHLEAVLGWFPNSSDVISGLDIGGGVANGSFEQTAPFGGYGWRYYTDAGVTRVYDPYTAYAGNYFLQLVDGAQSHQPVPANDGDTVTVIVWMRSTVGGEQADLTIDFRDQEMWTTPLQTTTESKELTTDWQQFTMCVVAPTSSTNPVYHTRLTFTAAANDTVYIDDVAMSVTSPGIPCPCTPNEVHVEAVEASLFAVERGYKRGSANVVILDNCGSLVSGAMVTGRFYGDFDEDAGSLPTDQNGEVVFETVGSLKGKVNFEFCIEDLDLVPGDLSWDHVVLCGTN